MSNEYFWNLGTKLRITLNNLSVCFTHVKWSKILTFDVIVNNILIFSLKNIELVLGPKLILN